MKRTRIISILMLCLSLAGTASFTLSFAKTNKPDIGLKKTVNALLYYKEANPSAVKKMLKQHGLELSEITPVKVNKTSDYGRNIHRELNRLPESFAPINSINRASSIIPHEDRDVIYYEAGRFIDKDLKEQSIRHVTHDAEQFCGKHYRRVGEKEAFGICLFRHITTLYLFAEDTEQCERDLSALLPANTASERINKEIYLCIRKKGWRNPDNAADNIDLPPAR